MMSFVEVESPKLIPVIMNLRAKASPFNKPYLFHQNTVKRVAANTWWQNVDPTRAEIDDETTVKICNLMTSVASSASVERIFSTLGFVHSMVRNRLCVEKAGKLVFLHKLLNEDKTK